MKVRSQYRSETVARNATGTSSKGGADKKTKNTRNKPRKKQKTREARTAGESREKQETASETGRRRGTTSEAGQHEKARDNSNALRFRVYPCENKRVGEELSKQFRM